MKIKYIYIYPLTSKEMAFCYDDPSNQCGQQQVYPSHCNSRQLIWNKNSSISMQNYRVVALLYKYRKNVYEKELSILFLALSVTFSTIGLSLSRPDLG